MKETLGFFGELSYHSLANKLRDAEDVVKNAHKALGNLLAEYLCLSDGLKTQSNMFENMIRDRYEELFAHVEDPDSASHEHCRAKSHLSRLVTADQGLGLVIIEVFTSPQHTLIRNSVNFE